MTGKVTMSMIAEACGTSIGTVDRALNGRTGISDEMKKQILDAAARMGYKTNRHAGALSRRRAIRAAVVSCRRHPDFYSEVTRGVEQAQKELSDFGFQVELLLTDDLTDQQQNQLLDSTDLSCYDGLIINSAGAQTEERLKKLTQAGLPVVTFNTDAPDSGRLLYVGANAYASGQLGAEITGKLQNGKGNVAVFGNSAHSNAYVQRFSGFCQVIFSEYPDICLDPVVEAYHDEDSAFERTINYVNQHGNLQLLFTTNHSSTVGALRALEKLGRSDIQLIGFDISSATSDALRNNRCTALIFQDPYQQGYQAVHLLARHLLEDWQPSRPLLYIKPQIVMKYNLDFPSDAELFHSEV